MLEIQEANSQKLMTDAMVDGITNHIAQFNNMFDGLKRELQKQDAQLKDYTAKIETQEKEIAELQSKVSMVQQTVR